MARIGRLVIAGVAHHVTQRGVRSQNIFWEDEDRHEYLTLLKTLGEAQGLRYLGYCLMSNHVHLVIVPKKEDSLARGDW